MQYTTVVAAAAGLLVAACAPHSQTTPAAPAPEPTAASAAPAMPGTLTPPDSTPPPAPARVQGAAPMDSGVETAMESPFFTMNRSDWPGPNGDRDAAGAPGPHYWQQRADYDIVATLDTAAKSLGGTVTVHYTNNSPDTLRFVWMQLDQNLFRAASEGSYVFPGGQPQ